jgi:hypothetical protein
MAKGGPQVPAWPFADWLNQRIAKYEACAQAVDERRSVLSRVADECGWGQEDAGLRKLYRFRHMQKGTSVKVQGQRNKHRKVDITAHSFLRDTVEDACHVAGIDFTELYVGWAEQKRGKPGRPVEVLRFIDAYSEVVEDLLSPVVVRESYCVPCGEVTLRDSAGACHWCAGASEFQKKLQRRGRDRELWRERAAA